jgi:hypothetical protein
MSDIIYFPQTPPNPFRAFLIVSTNTLTDPSHNRTALEHLEQLGQPLLNQLLNLIILVLLPTTMMLPTLMLPAMGLAPMMLPRIPTVAGCLRRRRHLMHCPTLQVNENPPFILLRAVLQPQFPAYLLNPRLDLLDMVPAVVPLSHNNVKVAFPSLPCDSNSLFQHILRFLDKKAMEVDGVAGYAAFSVVLSKYIVTRLAVVLVHFRSVLFTLLGEFVGACAIA